MSDARTVIQQLFDELEDHGTTFDDNPPRLYCNSGCGGESTKGTYGCTFKHAPDCSYEKALRDAREWLAAEPATEKSALGPCIDCGQPTEPSYRCKPCHPSQDE